MWEAIEQAVALIEAKLITKVEAPDFNVYRVPGNIRIDIKAND